MQLSEERIRAALRHEVTYAYQPIVNLRGQPVTYVEALGRWHPPQPGIGFGDLLAAIDDGPLADLLTSTGLDHVLADLTQLQTTFGPHTAVGLNLSRNQLANPDRTASLIETALARHDAAPSALCIEVVEDVRSSDHQRIQELLHYLRALGVRVMLDDFGTGSSSLSALTDLEFDGIKIDRRFVAGLLSHRNARSVIEAVVSFGENAGIDVVAEGVEDALVLTELERVGCYRVQGYYFGRPIAIGDLTPDIGYRGLRTPLEVAGTPLGSAATPNVDDLRRRIDMLRPRTTSTPWPDLRVTIDVLKREITMLPPQDAKPLMAGLGLQATLGAMYAGDSDAAFEWAIRASSLAAEIGDHGLSAMVLATVSTVPPTSVSTKFVGTEALARALQLRATAAMDPGERAMLDNALGVALAHMGLDRRAIELWHEQISNADATTAYLGDSYACANLLEAELASLEVADEGDHSAARAVSLERCDRAIATFHRRDEHPGMFEGLAARRLLLDDDVEAASEVLGAWNETDGTGIMAAFIVVRARAMLARATGDTDAVLRHVNDLMSVLREGDDIVRVHRLRAKHLQVVTLKAAGLIEQAFAAQSSLLSEQMQLKTFQINRLFDWQQICVDVDLQFAHLVDFFGLERSTAPRELDPDSGRMVESAR